MIFMKNKIDDIQLEDVIFFLMERTMRKAKAATKKMFKENNFDLTVEQWILMKRIYENIDTGISQIDLANTTFKEPAAVTRTLDILERKAFIERIANPEDRRVFLINVTKTGKALVEEITPIVQSMRAESFSGLKEKDMDTLKKLINKIYENIE